MPLAVYQDVQWSSVTCVIMMNGGFATNNMSSLYDHANKYDDERNSHVKWRWNLHGNISRNGYGIAMIGSCGGCFEEDIIRLMCNRAYHVTWFGYTDESCTDPQGENGLCTVLKMVANMKRWGCVCPWFHISHKELTYLLQDFISSLEAKYYSHAPREEVGRS